MRLIEAKGLSVVLGGQTVLHHVDFVLDRGEIVTIVGPNGSGKSTLLKALLGAVPLAAGKVTATKGVRFGYVPQRLMIDRTMPITVARFLSLPERRKRPRLEAALADVGAGECIEAQMTSLSGGQLQRVLLARAILGDPDVLILDEPTQGLDQPGTANFYQLVEEVRARLGCAVLMVSHDLHVVMSASDRVICLNGHVCCEGSPDIVSSAPQYRALFGTGTKGALALYRHAHDHQHDSAAHERQDAERALAGD
ncbi:MAG: metal ABC transporter ATP-binding protein [Devosia sp.]